MILLSNVIKSFAYYPIEDKKIVEMFSPRSDLTSDLQTDEDGLTEEMQNEINDAKA